MKDLVTWKTCKTCGEAKELDQFPVQINRYYHKGLQKYVERPIRRCNCYLCLAEKARQRKQIATKNINDFYQSKDLSKATGPKETVIKHLQGGSWITVIQDVGTSEVERLLTNGHDDFMTVYPNTLKWLEKNRVVVEVPTRQRTTLLIEKKFILAKEYENKQEPKPSSHPIPTGGHIRTPLNG